MTFLLSLSFHLHFQNFRWMIFLYCTARNNFQTATIAKLDPSTRLFFLNVNSQYYEIEQCTQKHSESCRKVPFECIGLHAQHTLHREGFLQRNETQTAMHTEFVSGLHELRKHGGSSRRWVPNLMGSFVADLSFFGFILNAHGLRFS